MKLPRPSFGFQVALLALGLALLLLPTGGSGSLDRAEVYFMDAARAMAEKGDWLVPHYRDEPFFDKPILTYWFIAASFRVFGPTPEAARLVPAAAAVGVVLVTVWLGVLLHGRRAGLRAGLILATTLPFLSFGRIAMADTLMVLLATIATTLAWLAYERPRSGRWLVAALGLTLGLGFATKGPIALLLPGLALAALAWCRRGERLPLTPLPALAGLALLLGAGLGWYAALYLRLGAEPLRYFFLRENLQRFAAATYDSGQPPWYFVVTYLTQGAPWSLCLPLALRDLWRNRAQTAAAPTRWLALSLLLMLLPLSASRGKLDYYLLPLYPFASVWLGALFARHWDRLERGWARVLLLLLALGAAGATLLAPRLPAPWLPTTSGRVLTAVVAAGLTLLLAFVAWRPSPSRVAAALAALAACFFGLYVYVWAPAFHAGQPNERIVADVVREHGYRPDVWLALCDDAARVHRDVIFATALATLDTCQLWGPASAEHPYLMLLRETEWKPLHALPNVRFVGSYRYVPATALGLRGLFEPQQARKLVLLANYDTLDPLARRRARQWRRELGQRTEQIRRTSALDPTVMGNERSRLFHRAGCPSFECPACTLRFVNEAEARAAGFLPADCCDIE